MTARIPKIEIVDDVVVVNAEPIGHPFITAVAEGLPR